MLLASPTALATAFDAALVDLDGVTYRGTEPIAHAARSLERARADGMALVFVTNNASREPEEVAGQLVGLGIPARPDEIMTAAQAAAALLVEHLPASARVLVVGGAGLLTAVRSSGFSVVTSADEAPDAVVQGFAPEVSWRDLAEAAYAVQRGARHVVSNRDMTLPTERGFAPGNGSLVAAVCAATGSEPISAGKPEPTMYLLAAERVGSTRPLVVGDRLDTDLAGARAAGIPGLHVFTGVSGARDAVLASSLERPSFIGADLRSMLTPHEAPEPAPDGWWSCGAASARVRTGRLELRGGHAQPRDGDEQADQVAVSIDAVRAACAAVWSAVDDGIAVDPRSVPDLRVHGTSPDGPDR